MDGSMGLPAGPPWQFVLVTLAAVAAGLLLGQLLVRLPEWWLNRRAQRDWDRGEAERRRLGLLEED